MHDTLMVQVRGKFNEEDERSKEYNPLFYPITDSAQTRDTAAKFCSFIEQNKNNALVRKALTEIYWDTQVMRIHDERITEHIMRLRFAFTENGPTVVHSYRIYREATKRDPDARPNCCEYVNYTIDNEKNVTIVKEETLASCYSLIEAKNRCARDLFQKIRDMVIASE